MPVDWQPPLGELYAGGYLEDRAIYDSPIFKGRGEPRTIHLGIDVFACVGTPVFAPLDGVVHSCFDNNNELDYGPTILLEHAPTDDLRFWTLYGHLNRDCLNGLTERAKVRAGEEIGRFGDVFENGGWAPHLHFQVILDLGGRRGDYPGVCRKSETDRMAAICPDPAPLLGLSFR